MSPFTELRNFWSAASIQLAAPALADEVARFEQRHRVELPKDFKEYLMTSGGMLAGETDEHLMFFAGLADLDDPGRLTTLAGSRQGLIFADYSIFAHCYVLDLTDGGVLAADGERSVHLAETFQGFIEQYLEEPGRIADCWTTDVPSKKQ